MITTTPLMASRAFAGTPIAYIEVVMAWMTSGPDDRREERESPARPERRPADDDGEDGVELEVEADVVGVRRPDVRARDEPGHARAEAAEHVGEELHALLVDAAVEARSAR